MARQIRADEIIPLLLPVLEKYKVTKAGIFGSFVTGTFNSGSDIDLLVELNPELSLIDYLSIKNELEDKTNRKVDLVEYDSLKPQLKEIILKQEIRII